MSVTNQQKEYKRLRSYLNPFLRGPNVDAVLNALAAGSSSYLIENAAAVNDQLYITTASGVYLDRRLNDYGIIRPTSVGLSDDIFRQIGIEVKNRKQVRDLVNNILNIMFGDEFTRATSDSQEFEPYNLSNNDNLIINFDENQTVNVVFKTEQFQSIAAATAIEVANAITETLRSKNFKGTAIAKNDGNGNYVKLLSDTVGPSSSVTVLGGKAQNKLKFPAIIPTGGNFSTQWTVSLQPGGIIRFTWTGGADPLIGEVIPDNYVNIFGGGFLGSGYEGSYPVVNAVGGSVNNAYFEVENPEGTEPPIGFNPVTQGGSTLNPTILFFNPERRTLSNLKSYAAIYQAEAKVLQVFLPAATKVVRRSRLGSAHLHDPIKTIFYFEQNPNLNDQFIISNISTLIAGVDFPIAFSYLETMENLKIAINSIGGLTAVIGKDIDTGKNILTVYQNNIDITLIGNYIGLATITTSGILGDVLSIQPNQNGPYIYDLSQGFVISSIATSLDQNLNDVNTKIINVKDSSQFPDEQGYIVLNYGTENQEGPIPYVGRPSNGTLLINPTYTFQKTHDINCDVALVAQKNSVEISRDGLDWPFYITDVVSGRIYCQSLIESVAATGINIVFTILYPSDIGLSKWGTEYTENPKIWGY